MLLALLLPIVGAAAASCIVEPIYLGETLLEGVYSPPGSP